MADNKVNNNMEMDWDDDLVNDGQEFIILEEGDYTFEVTDFERGRFPGSAKISPSNKATLTLLVTTDKGLATCKTDLILNRVVEFKLAQFFRCIGQKKHGERLKMDWSKVVGSKGRAHFKPRTWVGNDGQERQANDVERFYDYDERYFAQAKPAKKAAKPKADEWASLPDDIPDEVEGIPFE